ncbi:hypothetical protein M0813_23515 [Anaeramoeba flamelloides]|uniref:Transmembrane protein n=1 Tax=Anaeramoeba flamelloides TaxID=1746091 RepID=A0ABQ8YAL4_9EUKA|nr:hypothetical protein M0813_23515 [Anaeramoeba flamelloides]
MNKEQKNKEKVTTNFADQTAFQPPIKYTLFLKWKIVLLTFLFVPFLLFTKSIKTFYKIVKTILSFWINLFTNLKNEIEDLWTKNLSTLTSGIHDLVIELFKFVAHVLKTRLKWICGFSLLQLVIAFWFKFLILIIKYLLFCLQYLFNFFIILIFKMSRAYVKYLAQFLNLIRKILKLCFKYSFSKKILIKFLSVYQLWSWAVNKFYQDNFSIYINEFKRGWNLKSGFYPLNNGGLSYLTRNNFGRLGSACGKLYLFFNNIANFFKNKED